MDQWPVLYKAPLEGEVEKDIGDLSHLFFNGRLDILELSVIKERPMADINEWRRFGSKVPDLKPAQVELPTTFYSLLDWDKIVEGAIASDQPAWIYAYQQARIPSIMNFVPTKVMLFTENSVFPFRDYDGQQSKFIAEVLGKENIHGDYRLINAIPPLKVVVLKAHGDQR